MSTISPLDTNVELPPTVIYQSISCSLSKPLLGRDWAS